MGEYNYGGGFTETSLDNIDNSDLPEFNPRASPPSAYHPPAADHPPPAKNAPFPSPASWWEILPTFGKLDYGVGPLNIAPTCCSPSLPLYGAPHHLLPTPIMPCTHNQYLMMAPTPPRPPPATRDPSLTPPSASLLGGGSDPINRQNPYLADLPPPVRSPAASWHTQMQHQHQQQRPAMPEEWSCGPETYQPRVDTRLHGDLHPVFTDPQLSDYHPLQHQQQQEQASTIASSFSPLHQGCPNYASTFGGRIGSLIGEDWAQGYGVDPIRLVRKSQSMRALCEENAALRRALYSMRRATLLDHSLAMHGEPIQPFYVGGGEQDRCITNDAAEGRTLSMRERGRWARHLHGDVGAAAGGSASNGGYNHGFPMRAATPEHQYSRGTGTALSGTHRRYHHHPRQQQQQPVWDDMPPEHPLFYGGSCGGWPEDSTLGFGEYYGADMYHGRQSGAGSAVGHDTNNGEGLSLKQLLVQTERLGAEKRQGSKKKGIRQVRQEAEICKPEQAAMASSDALLDQESLYCAMCGGKLQQAEVQAIAANNKKPGLPLRLCSACHPRAAASLPHSTTKSPPLSSSHARHRVAAAIFMACRPTTTATNGSSKRVKPKNRIVDICRHFVGLSAKPPAA